MIRITYSIRLTVLHPRADGVSTGPDGPVRAVCYRTDVPAMGYSDTGVPGVRWGAGRRGREVLAGRAGRRRGRVFMIVASFGLY
jgi:hypothetical protein